MNYQAVSRLLAVHHQNQINVGSTILWKFRHRVPEVICTLCQYEDGWKQSHPTLYPLDPASVEAWRSHQDTLMGKLTLLETKAVLRVEIYDPYSHSRRGSTLDRTMTFELSPDQAMDMFHEYIKHRCNSIVNDEYERILEERANKERDDLMANMLSESMIADCDWSDA